MTSVRFNHRAGLALLAAVFLCSILPATAGSADEVSASEAAAAIAQEPAAKTITPTLVRRQLQHYAQLRQVWTRRQIPDGMQPPHGPATARNSHVPAVSLLMENVQLRFGAGIGYYVDHLEAALVPTEAGSPVNFDDPWSFTIHIFRGHIRLRPKQIDALFNHYILTYAPRSILQVANSTSRNTLKISLNARLWGVLPPIGYLPATLVGTIKATADNRLVYTPRQARSLGLPLGAILGAVNLRLDALVTLDRPGVTLQGNKLYLDPETLFPPPRLTIDNLSQVALSDKGLELTFTSDVNPDFDPPPVDSESYLWMQSGDAKFFDVVLVNAHLQIIGKTQDEPLRFNLYHYRAQAAAGKVFARRNGALVVKVPNDFPTGIVSGGYRNRPHEQTQ